MSYQYQVGDTVLVYTNEHSYPALILKIENGLAFIQSKHDPEIQPKFWVDLSNIGVKFKSQGEDENSAIKNVEDTLAFLNRNDINEGYGQEIIKV